MRRTEATANTPRWDASVGIALEMKVPVSGSTRRSPPAPSGTKACVPTKQLESLRNSRFCSSVPSLSVALRTSLVRCSAVLLGSTRSLGTWKMGGSARRRAPAGKCVVVRSERPWVGCVKSSRGGVVEVWSRAAIARSCSSWAFPGSQSQRCKTARGGRDSLADHVVTLK